MWALDLETSCNVGCTEECEHAVYPPKAKIDIIGLWKPNVSPIVFYNAQEFQSWLEKNPDITFCGHNLKFDFCVLHHNGIKLDKLKLQHDSYLMAIAMANKIDENWLIKYEEDRKDINKVRPGQRKAGPHSLKTLAPYVLGVAPFWESHNKVSAEYVLKDAEYSYRLCEKLLNKLTSSENSFYTCFLKPLSSLLLEMELSGIKLDLGFLKERQIEDRHALDSVERDLRTYWKSGIDAYIQVQLQMVRAKYHDLYNKAVEKAPHNEIKLKAKYASLCEKAILNSDIKFNFASPAQLRWLLQDFLNLDLTKDGGSFDDTTSTGKGVLERLSGEGREDIKAFLRYRKLQKADTAFYGPYMDAERNGTLYTTYNVGGTRTGRLSSSSPNLQQVPSYLRPAFIARPGHKLLTFDMAAIEPRLVAYYSEDPVLFNVLKEGIDFHGLTTKILFGLSCKENEIKTLYPTERKVGKEIGLALMYCAGPKTLQLSAQKFGFKWTFEYCKERYEDFKSVYKGVFVFRDQLVKDLSSGKKTHNILGRPVSVMIDKAYMTGLNTLIQGSASDLVCASAIRLAKELKKAGLKSHILLLVHDEIVVEALEEEIGITERLIKECFTTHWNLVTSLGKIELSIEGRISSQWEK